MVVDGFKNQLELKLLSLYKISYLDSTKVVHLIIRLLDKQRTQEGGYNRLVQKSKHMLCILNIFIM